MWERYIDIDIDRYTHTHTHTHTPFKSWNCAKDLPMKDF